MLTVTKADYLFHKEKGLLVSWGYTHEEMTKFISELKAGDDGWVEVRYPCGHRSNIHFTVKEDGQPRFTNSNFDTTDIEVISRAMGELNAFTFLRKHI